MKKESIFKSKLHFWAASALIFILFLWILNIYFEIIPNNLQKVKITNKKTPFQIFGPSGIFVFFTTQLNIVGPIFLLLYSFKVKIKGITRFSFRIITSYYLIMFIVFWCILAWFLKWNYIYEVLTNVFLHFITVLIILLMYIYDPNKHLIKKNKFYFSLIYPIFYYIFSIILFFTTKIVIYPFLDFTNPFFIKLDLNNIILIFINLSIFIFLLIIFIFIYFIFLEIEKRIFEKNKIN